MSKNYTPASVADLIIAKNVLAEGKIGIGLSEEVKNLPLVTNAKHDKLKAAIWKEAKENQVYYLGKKAHANTPHPWFHFVKKETQYSEFVMLNAEMAQVMLDNIWNEDDGNRTMKVHIKDTYRKDILTGKWIPSDEGIGIDYNGIIYNGRHRLTALVESGIEYPFYITFNVLEEAKFTVDSGAKRSSSEKLKLIMTTSLGNRTVSFCRAIMRGMQLNSRFSETEIAEFAVRWQSLIDWVAQHLKGESAEVQAAIAKAYLWHGPELIEPFCHRLTSLTFVEDGDPARALYQAMQAHRTSRMNKNLVKYKKVLNALKFLMNKKPVTRLHEHKDDDIFEWRDNWALPPGSWWDSPKGQGQK